MWLKIPRTHISGLSLNFQYTFRFHNLQEIYWTAKQLVTSEDKVYPMEFVQPACTKSQVILRHSNIKYKIFRLNVIKLTPPQACSGLTTSFSAKLPELLSAKTSTT
jgi:hypothetical protein